MLHSTSRSLGRVRRLSECDASGCEHAPHCPDERSKQAASRAQKERVKGPMYEGAGLSASNVAMPSCTRCYRRVVQQEMKEVLGCEG